MNGSPVALQSRLELGKVDANPSTTQVVEFREQIVLADNAGALNRDRIWALEGFWDEVAISVGRDLSWMQTRFDLCRRTCQSSGASNVNFLSCNYPTPCPMACWVDLLIGGEDDARFRPNYLALAGSTLACQ